MNFTPQQWLIAAVGMLAALGGVSSQLATLFGQAVATDITAGAAVLTVILTVPLGMMTGQSAVVKQVAAMPGVEDIKVNAAANKDLAVAAVDPKQSKVNAVPMDLAAIQKTAMS